MIKVSTTYSERSHAVITKASAMYKYYKLLRNIGICGFIVCLIALFAVDDDSSFIPCMLGIFLGLIIGAIIKLYRTAPERTYHKVADVYSGLRYEIEFRDDEFVMDSVSDASSKHSSGNYSILQSVKEQDGWFVIFVANSGYLAFNSSDITEGSAEELRSLLREKLGNKVKLNK